MPNYRISTSIQTLRPPYRHLSWTTRTHNVDHRASSKLFADAEREEAAEQTGTPPPRAAILPRAAPEHPNWTGDERMEDAVLRMLVDKYKPLRTGSMQTSEDKIRRVPPLAMSAQPSTPTPTPISETPSSVPSLPSPSPSRHPRVYRADEPLLPAVEGHKPWLTTFKAPSHPDAASIRYGQFPALRSGSSSSESSSRAVAQSGAVDDDRARRQRREAKKRSEVAGRLTRAKESTLDYRLGIIKGAKGGGAQAQVQVQVRQNPVSMKGWAGLVEERIERARLEGHFRAIKGRGKPLERSNEEHNPFIAREEFLMNRIVQRQGAAPQWVEVQGELEAAVTAFRAVLRQSWVRRAVRMITLSQRPPCEMSLANVRALRDGEWETRERAYHESALAEVNALARKYNALAPYAVRRAYYVRDVELGRAYEESGEEILRELGGRQGRRPLRGSGGAGSAGDEREVVDDGVRSLGNVLGLRDIFLQWLGRRRRRRA